MRRLIALACLLAAASAQAAPYSMAWDAATQRALEAENARRDAASANPDKLADPATDTMAPPPASNFGASVVPPATPTTPVMASDTREQPGRRLSDDDSSPFMPGEGYGARSRATPRIVGGGAKGEAVNQSILSIDQLTKPTQ